MHLKVHFWHVTLEQHNQIPPAMYRLCAAENGRALGPDELAKRSGLSRSSVQRISAKLKWDSITMAAANKFTKACGFQFGSHKEINKRLKVLRLYGVRGMKHLQVGVAAPLWQRGANANRIKFISKIISQT